MNKANRDLKNLAYGMIREKIINCDYKPGSMLNEARLSDELGFSRTPVREALSRIAFEGYVRILPKKGVLVTDISLDDVRQIFQARLEIEPVAVRMAGPRLPEKELLHFRETFSGEDPDVRVGFRLDTAMHLFIIEHCGNRFIVDMMQRLFDENTRVIISSKQNQCKIHDARLEHLEIIDLLLKRDIEGASQSMSAHIQSCKKAALDYFYNIESYQGSPVGTYKLHLRAGQTALAESV